MEPKEYKVRIVFKNGMKMEHIRCHFENLEQANEAFLSNKPFYNGNGKMLSYYNKDEIIFLECKEVEEESEVE